MNLVVADARLLAAALVAFYEENRTDMLDANSETVLKRIWHAEHSSYWIARMMHRLGDATPFERHLQIAEQEHVTISRAAATAMTENYVGIAAV